MAIRSLGYKTPMFSAPGFTRIKVLKDLETNFLGGRKLKLDISEEEKIISNDLFNELKDGDNFRTSHKHMVIEKADAKDKMNHVMTLIGGGIINNKKVLQFRDSTQKTDEYREEYIEKVLQDQRIDPKGRFLKVTLE